MVYGRSGGLGTEGNPGSLGAQERVGVLSSGGFRRIWGGGRIGEGSEEPGELPKLGRG